MERTTSSIKFYCRATKANKDGYAPVELSININSKRVFINLTRKEKPSVFKKETRKQTSDLSRYLELVREKINRIQTQLLIEGSPITSEKIREYIKTGGVHTYTLIALLNEYDTILRSRLGIDLQESTYRKYQRLFKEFREYIGNDNREIRDITQLDIQGYYSYISSREKTGSTASKMTKLKAVFRYAFENGKMDIFPFSQIKIRKDRPHIEFLTSEEMRRLCSLNSEIDRIEKVRDLFVLQAATGLSYADLAALRPEDIKVTRDNIHYIAKDRVKTGIGYTSIILKEGVEVLEKYRGDIRPIMLSNQKYNSYLKEIADLCHIQKNITTHLARKTYATYLLNSGVSIKTVSKTLGHSSAKLTESTYAKLLDRTVIEEVKEII